jgi:PKD repeat protein
MGTNTYAAAGSYPVSIVVTGPGSATTTINSIAQVADAPLSVENREAGQLTPSGPLAGAFQGDLATFVEHNPSATASQYTATINWGDGTTTTGTVSERFSGEFDVYGSHTYATAGVYLVSVTITDSDGGAWTTAMDFTMGTPSPLVTNNGTAIRATAGMPFTGVVGSFVDTNPKDDNAGTLFTAIIAWADGEGDSAATTAGTIAYAGNGEFLIYGTHTYDTPGDYYPQFTVSGPTSLTPPLAVDSYVNVAPAPA